MSASSLLETAEAPLELDLTMEELMDQLDPGWVAWAERGSEAGA